MKEKFDATEYAFLVANPNPQRVGCPGPSVLRQLAYRELPILEHPVGRHIGKCSPCFKSYREFVREWQRARFRKRILAAIGVAAMLIISMIGGAAHKTFKIDRGQAPPILTTVDLFDRPMGRGNESPRKPVALPATLVNVKIVLPRFSPAGEYTIAVSRDQNTESVIAQTVSQTQAGEGTRQVVTGVLDLRKIHAGPSYYLAIARNVNEGTYYYPLRIEPDPQHP